MLVSEKHRLYSLVYEEGLSGRGMLNISFRKTGAPLSGCWLSDEVILNAGF